jgi:oxygen-independent coproporphyrinogen-3 oxidase
MGETTPIPEAAYRDEYLQATELLLSEGYEHYEVSNFARPGFKGRHNQAYWELSPYLGLGNSAHSFRGGRRRWNLRDWPAYQEARMAGNPPWVSEEHLGPEEVRLERIWLGLRTEGGLVVQNPPAPVADLIKRWVAQELAEREGDSLRLTSRGWLLLDELAVDFDRALARSQMGSGKTQPLTG